MKKFEEYIIEIQYYINLYKFFKVHGKDKEAKEIAQILSEYIKEEGEYIW